MNDCIELFIRYEPRAKSKYEEVRDFLLQKNAKEVSEGFFVFNMNVNDFVSEIWTVLGSIAVAFITPLIDPNLMRWLFALLVWLYR